MFMPLKKAPGFFQGFLFYKPEVLPSKLPVQGKPDIPEPRNIFRCSPRPSVMNETRGQGYPPRPSFNPNVR